MSLPGPGSFFTPGRRSLILVALACCATPSTVLLAQPAEPSAGDPPAAAAPPPLPFAPHDDSATDAGPTAAAPDDTEAGATDTAAGSLDPVTADTPYWRSNLFGRFFRDQKFLLTTWWPAEVRRPWFTGPVLAGLALATTSNNDNREGFDRELGDYARAEASGRRRTFASRLSFLGNAGPGALFLGAGYLIGRWGHNDRLAEASSLSAEALLSTGLYTTVLKHVTARTRPANGGDGTFFDYSPQDGQVARSFPSGHAAGAFTVAAVFAGVYSDSRWAPWAAYGAAGLVGWSRLALHRHFPSDVLVGAMIGSSIGRMAVFRSRDTREPVTTIEPFVDPDSRGGGVVYTRRW